VKVTTDSDSALYWARQFRFSPDIYLDGKVVDHDYILEADEEAGTVIVAKMNGSSPCFAGGRYLTETLTGTVEIRGEAI
jgi:hypothetical protein